MSIYIVRWFYEEGDEVVVEAPDQKTAIDAVSDKVEGRLAFGDGDFTYECSDALPEDDDDLNHSLRHYKRIIANS